MRIVTILAAIALTAVAALMALSNVNPDLATTLPPTLPSNLPIISAALAALLLVLVLLDRRAAPEPKRVVAEAARPAPVPVAANQADAEVVSFLATLQERGRLIDFLMDDITPYSDAQVGAAARVVHEGCRSALQEHFRILPVRDEGEGAQVTVPAGFAVDEYRLIGKLGGEAPFNGVLVHRGWRTEWVKLPRVLRSGGDRLPTIAPAEVEIR